MGSWWSYTKENEEVPYIKIQTSKKESTEINKKINEYIISELFEELKNSPLFNERRNRSKSDER